MATTVRITEGANRTLDGIQARLLLLTGKRVSKQELLDLVLEVGPDVERLAARLHGIRYPLSKAAWRRIRRGIKDWGVETREEDINRDLYGWDQ